MQLEETSCPALDPLVLFSGRPSPTVAWLEEAAQIQAHLEMFKCEAQPGSRAQPAGASLVSRLPGAALAGCAPDPLNLAPSKAQCGSMLLLGPVATFPCVPLVTEEGAISKVSRAL